MDIQKYKDQVICRGSMALGSACGRCAKCLDEMKVINERLSPSVMEQHDKNYDDRLSLVAEITALRARVSELESGGWISVDDRLPECNIVKTKENKVSETVLTFGSDGFETERLLNGSWRASITHWQPLPIPPKK